MQPCFLAAAGQFQRTLARPPPAGKVAELKVQAHRSAFSYPAAVYLHAEAALAPRYECGATMHELEWSAGE